MPSSSASTLPCIPKALGIEGPVISASKTAAWYPLLAILTASIAVTRDFPTPPFPLTTPITFLTLLFSFKGLIILSLFFTEQSEPHDEQSWEQPISNIS